MQRGKQRVNDGMRNRGKEIEERKESKDIIMNERERENYNLQEEQEQYFMKILEKMRRGNEYIQEEEKNCLNRG